MLEHPILPSTADGDHVDPELIACIVDKHRAHRGGLIASLEEIQTECGYLPDVALRIVAERTGRSLVEVYGVANFYNLFSLKPRGKHLVSVCLGTACHVRGSQAILEEFSQQLDIAVGETTSDRQFTLKTVNCLGACALGPVVVIDGRYFAKMTRARVRSLIENTRNGVRGDLDEEERSTFAVDVGCPQCNHSLMDEGFYIEGRPSIRVTVSVGDQHGWLRLSSIYGNYNVYSEFEVPARALCHFFCPHCHSELTSTWMCSMCGAQMVQMIVRGGGTVRICPRRGCSGSESHMLDLT